MEQHGKKAPSTTTDAADETSTPPHSETVPVKRSLHPKTWRWWVWVLIAVVVVGAIVGGTVGGVLRARWLNAYPDYYGIRYTLQDEYSGRDFFDQFDYFTEDDPTHGFVEYVNRSVATSRGLTRISNATVPRSSLAAPDEPSAILRVDTSEKNATSGRKSVRVTSKKTYDTGLFVFDVHHSPYGCGTWPALWLVDHHHWPDNGEIDVMESVNMADTGNAVTLHTTKGCEIKKKRKRKQWGRASSYDCYNATNANQGCGVIGPDYTSGQDFNANIPTPSDGSNATIGGGVYALELRKQGIRAWFFSRADIPPDIRDRAPRPHTWGTPLADFPNLECDIEKHFRNQTIVINITLCGDWAGQDHIFGASHVCTGTCRDWVMTRAESFEEAYWEIGGFWVFGQDGRV